MLLRTNLTEMRMRVAEGKANKALTFCVAVMVAILLELLLAINPAYASTFTVTSTADSGPGSLQQAITDANNNDNAPTVDTINFNIPGTDTGCDATSGVCTISPGDGTPSSEPLPTIEEPMIIDGYSQPGSKSNSLAVGNNAVLKMELSGADAPTNTSGLLINADNSTVKGLVVTNWENGIFLGTGATGNKIQGNFIGTDASGTAAEANNIGVAALSANNTVGGTTAAARNIISGNTGRGVDIASATGGNKVQGNYIGTDKDGDDDLGNNDGVVLLSTPNNTIGGATAAARNIISGNTVRGVWIAFPDADGNKVQGNYIGTSARGTEPLGNSGDGVNIQVDADNNTIGGTTAAARNIISGNGGDGVEVHFTVGDPDGGATGNRILRNSIYDNSELGIDLVHENNLTEEVTPNDTLPPPDSDAGPNNLQNYPELTSAKTTKRVTTIKGTLTSTPGESFVIQFFSSPAPDPSGNGEGQKFKGQKSVTDTDDDGIITFTFKTEKKVPKGQVVTATATHQATGDTSEFSKACLVPAEPCAP